MLNLNVVQGHVRRLVEQREEQVTRYSLVTLRIVMGLLWLQNTSWKRPPFSSGNTFGKFVQHAVEYPVFAPYSWVVEHVVIPNFSAFGYMVMLVEGSLAILLLLGLYTRTIALVGIVQSSAILMSVLRAPGEWGWAYWMMLLIHVVLFATAGGGRFSVDHAISSGNLELRRRALMTFGGVVAFLGALALLRNGFSWSDGPGDQLWHQGEYVPWGRLARLNGRGSTVLLVLGLAGFVGAYLRQRLVAALVAGAGFVAAVSILSGLSTGDRWLGDDTTNNGVLYLVVAVGFAALEYLPNRPPQSNAEIATVEPRR